MYWMFDEEYMAGGLNMGQLVARKHGGFCEAFKLPAYMVWVHSYFLVVLGEDEEIDSGSQFDNEKNHVQKWFF